MHVVAICRVPACGHLHSASLWPAVSYLRLHSPLPVHQHFFTYLFCSSCNVSHACRMHAGLFMDSAGVPGQSKDLSLADTRAVADLKRLAFIPSYSAYYSRKVASLYSKSRSRLPSALQPGLEAMETRMSAVGAPVVHAVQLRSEHLLSSLDRKVCQSALPPI